MAIPPRHPAHRSRRPGVPLRVSIPGATADAIEAGIIVLGDPDIQTAQDWIRMAIRHRLRIDGVSPTHQRRRIAAILGAADEAIPPRDQDTPPTR